MQTLTQFILSAATLLLLACGGDTHSSASADSKNDRGVEKLVWDSIKNYTVFSLLERLSLKNGDSNQLNIIELSVWQMPRDWVKPADIDSLMKLVKLKSRCKCLVDPLSSRIPTDDYADLGGFAIFFLKNYRENGQSFGLYQCPKTNEKEADELLKWWMASKK